MRIALCGTPEIFRGKIRKVFEIKK